jgi:hypothetical protein
LLNDDFSVFSLLSFAWFAGADCLVGFTLSRFEKSSTAAQEDPVGCIGTHESSK